MFRNGTVESRNVVGRAWMTCHFGWHKDVGRGRQWRCWDDERNWIFRTKVVIRVLLSVSFVFVDSLYHFTFDLTRSTVSDFVLRVNGMTRRQDEAWNKTVGPVFVKSVRASCAFENPSGSRPAGREALLASTNSFLWKDNPLLGSWHLAPRCWPYLV